MRKFVIGVLALAVLGLGILANPFYAPDPMEMAQTTRDHFGIQPFSSVSQDDVAALEPFLNRSQLAALWEATIGVDLETAEEVLAVEGIGEGALSVILVFFNLETE